MESRQIEGSHPEGGRSSGGLCYKWGQDSKSTGGALVRAAKTLPRFRSTDEGAPCAFAVRWQGPSDRLPALRAGVRPFGPMYRGPCSYGHAVRRGHLNARPRSVVLCVARAVVFRCLSGSLSFGRSVGFSLTWRRGRWVLLPAWFRVCRSASRSLEFSHVSRGGLGFVVCLPVALFGLLIAPLFSPFVSFFVRLQTYTEPAELPTW